MPGTADRAQRASDATALTITAALIWGLCIGHPFQWHEVGASQYRPDTTAVELSLESAPIDAPVAPPKPQPVPKHQEVRKPQTAVAAVTAPADPIAATSEAIPEDAAVVAAGPTASSEPPSRSTANADLEAQYAAALRDDIDRRTQSAALAQNHMRHTAGEVRVSFIVTRAGEPKAVTLLHSSGSAILDHSALTIVAVAHYPPMPAAIYVNEAEHLFAVTIEFRAAARQAWAH
jgi:TonB family protein